MGDCGESTACSSVGGTFPPINTDHILQCVVSMLLKAVNGVYLTLEVFA